MEAILACYSALSPQNDWSGWQNGVNYDIFAQTPLMHLARSPSELDMEQELEGIDDGSTWIALCGNQDQHLCRRTRRKNIAREKRFRLPRKLAVTAASLRVRLSMTSDLCTIDKIAHQLNVRPQPFVFVCLFVLLGNYNGPHCSLSVHSPAADGEAVRQSSVRRA